MIGQKTNIQTNRDYNFVTIINIPRRTLLTIKCTFISKYVPRV